MAFISLRQLLDHAAEQGYGVPAFNINNMEQLLAIMAGGATRPTRPVIVQAQPRRPLLRRRPDAATHGAGRGRDVAGHPGLPAPGPRRRRPATCLSADPARLHERDDGRLARGGRQDAGRLRLQRRRHARASPRWRTRSASRSRASWAASARSRHGERARRTATAARAARPRPAPDRPRPGGDFVAATGVDALAVAIGTSHGAYKFTRQPTGDILAMDVVKAIHARLPGHAPRDARLLVGAAGAAGRLQRATAAQMPQTWGVPVAEIQEGIRHGVRKINIDTDCRHRHDRADPEVAAQKRARVRSAATS